MRLIKHIRHPTKKIANTNIFLRNKKFLFLNNEKPIEIDKISEKLGITEKMHFILCEHTNFVHLPLKSSLLASTYRKRYSKVDIKHI